MPIVQSAAISIGVVNIVVVKQIFIELVVGSWEGREDNFIKPTEKEIRRYKPWQKYTPSFQEQLFPCDVGKSGI